MHVCPNVQFSFHYLLPNIPLDFLSFDFLYFVFAPILYLVHVSNVDVVFATLIFGPAWLGVLLHRYGLVVYVDCFDFNNVQGLHC